MGEIIDEIVLAGIGTLLLASSNIGGESGSPSVVAAFLGAIVLVCLEHCLRRPGPLVAQCVFYGATILFAPCAMFLLVAAYGALHEQRWVARLAWVIPFAATVGLGHAPLIYALAIGVLCVAASLLAIRDVRARSERDGLRFAYDDLRGRYLQAIEAADAANATAGSGAGDAAGPEAPRDAMPEVFADLTKREMAIVRLVAEGMDNREIASSLFLSEGTVRNHVSAILAKKNLSNRTQIAITYLKSA